MFVGSFALVSPALFSGYVVKHYLLTDKGHIQMNPDNLFILFVQWAGKEFPAELLFSTDLTHGCSYYSVPHLLLRERLAKHCIHLRPSSFFSKKSKADAIISIDLPVKRRDIDLLLAEKVKPGAPKILIAMESPIARPELLSGPVLEEWNLVFHYSEGFVEQQNIRLYNLPSNLDFLHLHGTDYRHDRTRLVGMMGTNKPSKLANVKANPLCKVLDGYRTDSRSLMRWLSLEDGLSLRRKIASRMAFMIPSEFKIFGGQWDGKPYAFRHRLIKPRSNPCSMGHVDANTISIISGFKFFFAIENSIFADGYLTEKIFSCIRAGSIPIYKPISNSKLFPLEADEDDLPFVDLRRYASVKALLKRLHGISSDERKRLLNNGSEFLSSDAAVSHTPEAYVRQISTSILSFIRSWPRWHWGDHEK